MEACKGSREDSASNLKAHAQRFLAAFDPRGNQKGSVSVEQKRTRRDR